MKLLTILTIFFIVYAQIQTKQIGIIRNASLFLTNTNIGITNQTNCQSCLCNMIKINGNDSIVSFNCLLKNINSVVCEFFTMINYETSSFYRMKINTSSTFYFLQLPTKQQVQVTTESGTTIIPSVSQDIFWSFDGNLDDLYNNYNGIGMNNCNFSSPGYTGYGSALSLNSAKSQYVLVNKYLNLTYHSFTWEMWAYPTYINGTGDYVLIGTCSSKTTDECLYLMIRRNVSYFAFYSDDCSGTTLLNTKQWYHLAFVYDFENRTQYIYLNGNIECMRNQSGPYQGNSNVTLIGAIQLPTETVKYWSGYIDQVSYEPRVKTPAEILSDATLVAYYSFDGGSFFDSGPNKINGTGVSVSAIAGRVNEGLLFNNSNAYFRASGFTLLGFSYRSYSFSLWIYRLESLNNTGGTIVHVSQNSTGLGWCIPFIGFSSSYQIVVQSCNTTGNLKVINGSLIAIGTWTHIAHSYSATNGIRLWVNGTLIGSSSPFTYGPSGVSDTIIIGSSLNGTSSCATNNIQKGQFYGIIDEVKVFSRELNQTDVSMLANRL